MMVMVERLNGVSEIWPYFHFFLAESWKISLVDGISWPYDSFNLPDMLTIHVCVCISHRVFKNGRHLR
jgi:hypothetical protein